MRPYVALFLLVFISQLLVGCEDLALPTPIPDRVLGMAPVYIDSTEGKIITTLGPDLIIDGRAFAVLGDTIFIVDHLRGIHVINNAMPDAPERVSFIAIPGCTSVAVNGNFLYVNNLSDLVTLDVSNPLNAVEVDREAGLYPQPLDFPEGYIGFFSCYEPTLGFLAGWQEQLITFPECYIE